MEHNRSIQIYTWATLIATTIYGIFYIYSVFHFLQSTPSIIQDFLSFIETQQWMLVVSATATTTLLTLVTIIGAAFLYLLYDTSQKLIALDFFHHIEKDLTFDYIEGRPQWLREFLR